uniref:Solute carrier family 35 member B1 n=1 Tax=Denticeps clupeoides TaxID=299321 RepID=A0AAY4BRG4_9TELE
MAAGTGGGNERLRFIVCFLGVFVCYFYYGILQETITRGDYGHGEKKEKFRYATTLVFIQCIINAVFARICESCVCDQSPQYLTHQHQTLSPQFNHDQFINGPGMSAAGG